MDFKFLQFIALVEDQTKINSAVCGALQLFWLKLCLQVVT